MRKVLFFMLTSLDGYFEGPNQDINWHNVDAEFNEFAVQQLDASDLLVFGRVTYEGMAAYWPTSKAIDDDPTVAQRMNLIAKIVCSRSLAVATWANTRLIKKDAAAELRRLKQQPGKDIGLLGSADLAASLIPEGLIDEYRVIVNPVVLGKGASLFHLVPGRLSLKLMQSTEFRSGNVLLVYTPLKK